ncbi:hypothetical protein D3C73_1336990 [compost metagenome]|jgi:hypothetical protein
MKKLSPVCWSQADNATLPIWPVFCRVATRVTDTLWFDEVAQPNRLALTISATSECLGFIAELL